MFRGRILVLLALAIVACEEFPTEAPMLEQTWAVPGEDIVIGVAEVLPASISVAPDGSAFETTVPGTVIERTLGQMCAACAALDGTTAAKPAFTHTFGTTSMLASSLVAATVVGDEFSVRLAHDMGFDPLRPDDDPGADRGYLLIEVSSDGAVVGRDSISGDDTAFGPGTVLTPTIPIQEADITNVLDFEITIHSPTGDDAFIETSDTLGIEIEPALVRLTEATVEAGGITVSAPAASLEFQEVDEGVISRVQAGALVLDVDNPFGLVGTLDLDFDLGGDVIRKRAPLEPGASVVGLDFTGEQIREILGAGTVDVSAHGALAAPDGTMTASPGDALIMESTFELVILVGGSEGGN